METPILHEIKSLRATLEPTVYIADVDLTDMEGQRYECEYVSRPDDTFGLAPTVREAVDEWIADGKPVDPYEPPAPAVPDRVSARQFGLQLIAAGIMDQVDAWIAQQDSATRWAYEHSATFVRDDEMMQTGFAALGFSPAQIDAFFVAASAL